MVVTGVVVVTGSVVVTGVVVVAGAVVVVGAVVVQLWFGLLETGSVVVAAVVVSVGGVPLQPENRSEKDTIIEKASRKRRKRFIGNTPLDICRYKHINNYIVSYTKCQDGALRFFGEFSCNQKSLCYNNT